MIKYYCFLFITTFYITNGYTKDQDSLRTHRLQEIVFSQPKKNNNFKTLYSQDLIQGESGTLNDLLSTLPSLESDMEGNIRLRGSDKLTVLINGQPSTLLGDYRNELLIQLPASAIERIEVNHTPDASERAEGTAGTVNIILKEGDEKYLTGTIHANAANGDRYSAGGNMSIPVTPFLQVNAGIDYKREYRIRTFKNTIITNPGIDSKRNEQLQDNSANARPQSVLSHLSLDWNKGKNHLKTSLLFAHMKFDRTGNIHNSETKKEARVIRNNKQKNQGYGGSVSYEYGNKSLPDLYIDFSYRHSAYDDNNDYKRVVSRPINKTSYDKLFIDQKNNEYEINAGSFVGVFKIGYNGYFLSSGNINLKENYNEQTGVYELQSDANYNLGLIRDIHALFVQYNETFGRWHLSAGMRGEYTHRVTELKNENSRTTKDYWHLYPSASLSVDAGRNNFLSFSYQQRVNRPTFKDLNPFTDQTDPTDITQGNPGLKPEIINNLTLGYRYSRPVIDLYPTIFYRHRSHTIASLVNTENISVKENLYRTQSAGIELESEIRPLKWMTVNLSGDTYYDEIQADKTGGKRGYWAWEIQGRLSFKVTPTTTLQCSGFYMSDLVTAQGKILSHYRVDAGISQKIASGRGTITLNVNDWLNSSDEITVIDTKDLYKRTQKQRDGRIVWIGFAWNFQKTKLKQL